MENKIQLMLVITNAGYSEEVMKIAKTIGARGGTIFNAVGSASIAAEKLYGININPEKEVTMILVSKDLTKNLLSALYDGVGSDTLAQGIAFTLPVEEATSNLIKQYSETK